MLIRWLGHAAFSIQGEGITIITDPYDPELTNLEPIGEQADIVLRSSSDDQAHCFVDTIPKGYKLLTATDFVEQEIKNSIQEKNTVFYFMPSQESLIHKEVPRENAFYKFELENVKIAHLGDVGNKLSDKQLDFLEGTEILIAPAGGPPTIDLDDLADVINQIKPKIVIPMHFRIPGPKFFMLPVDEFTKRFDNDAVKKISHSEIKLTRETLPETTQIFILEASLVKK